MIKPMLKRRMHFKNFLVLNGSQSDINYLINTHFLTTHFPFAGVISVRNFSSFKPTPTTSDVMLIRYKVI